MSTLIVGAMTRYVINPPVHVRGSDIIRSTEDAVRFVRAASHPGDMAAIRLATRPENARNPQIAQGLADELRVWLDQRGLSRVAHHLK